ncbi:MAG: peptidylprolyl isomerase, partial [Chitinophagaceae bacterium]
EQLMGNVWNQEVDRVIMEQQYKALGIVVTPKELSELMFDEQLSPLKREFTDPKTGQFKAAEARTAFENIKKSKNAEQIELINNAYIEPTIQQTLRVKYSNLIQQSAYVPKWLVEKQIADNNAVASIDYVGVPYSTIQDSTVKVSDEDVKAYAQKHAKEFQKEDETRTVSFVSFSALPSSADSLNTLNLIAGLSGEFAATADVKSFLGRVGTEMPYYESYFSKSRLQQPNKDSLVRLQVGEVFGPYIDGNNYVYAKMIGVKQWPDSAKVRHILISTGNPQTGQVIRQDSVAKKLIDSLETAIRGGASFDELCAKYSDDPGSKDKGGVYDFFPQGQMV